MRGRADAGLIAKTSVLIPEKHARAFDCVGAFQSSNPHPFCGFARGSAETKLRSGKPGRSRLSFTNASQAQWSELGHH